ncbi:MAG: NADH-ubiquinone oxidoreductase-F iron-sulfur binding region domain-containing protein, partial [Planctomycetota bacterium]|nr:NADH-ubiquinone oxidoreductase-F iron-sulfur binding region domain-containing protein [Planctomycetota bacterium]
CTLAPVVQIDQSTYGHLTPAMIPGVVENFLARQDAKPKGEKAKAEFDDRPRGEIRIGLGSCCIAQGSGKVHSAIEQVLAESGAAADVKPVGCVGMCHQTPLLELVPKDGESRLFTKVDADAARALVLDQFKPKGIVRRVGHGVSKLLDRILTDEPGNHVKRHEADTRDGPICAFLGRQRHIATEYCGQINPTDFEEYSRHDGFKPLRRCMNDLSPEQIVEEVQAAGLRGRGGGGFPTGLKWQKVAEAPGTIKYVVCNGDEGDPGAFMDRMLLESFPYRIIEGMAIAARAVGADEGFFYIRAEYPLAVRRIREALDRCRQEGLIGDDILGSGLRLNLSIKEGAGAFVCGEETALLASLEGRRGMPRLRPPYPATSGLWEKPTLVNNVETLAILPWVFRHGAKEFAAMGTEKSRGTKVFALAGKIRRGGLIEVPMGITIREIVEEIGGGIAPATSGTDGPGKQKIFKAVQIGGPSGGCVPASMADTTVDYEALAAAGAIMGSGGLVVLDDSDCMVDIARYFLRFTQDQSCGKCTFCRIGTRRMLDILNRICEGQGRKGDLEKLETLARSVTTGSVCGLGKTAPNPVLSTLKYFRDEYEAHIEGRCPAGRCQKLIAYKINDRCIGCTICAQQCPVGAIAMTPYARHVIDDEKCTRCNICRDACPIGAVDVVSPR